MENLNDVANAFRRRLAAQDQEQQERIIAASDAYRALQPVTRAESTLGPTGFQRIPDEGAGTLPIDQSDPERAVIQHVFTSTSYPSTAFRFPLPSLAYALTMSAVVNVVQGDKQTLVSTDAGFPGLTVHWEHVDYATSGPFVGPLPVANSDHFTATATIPATGRDGFFRFRCTATLNGTSDYGDAIGFTSAYGPPKP